MFDIFTQIDPMMMALAFGITLFAGFVKGAVGFAMPLIMISGMSAFLSPEIALAALIIPTVLANGWQAVRGGVGPMLLAMSKFRLYLVIVLIFITVSAQLVRFLPTYMLFLILGVSVTLVTGFLLSGRKLQFEPKNQRKAEMGIATFAGLLGGVSGVWGPPTVAYLTAIDTPKKEQVQVQGVIYGTGAIVLTLAHLKSGVLNENTLPLSVAMIIPAMIGMGIGFQVNDRLDQPKFKRATLFVLAIAGLNLIRKGLMG